MPPAALPRTPLPTCPPCGMLHTYTRRMTQRVWTPPPPPGPPGWAWPVLWLLLAGEVMVGLVGLGCLVGLAHLLATVVQRLLR